MRRRRNPLLAHPPGHHHRLTDEHRLVSRGWPEPWKGVFTATDERIAVGYAANAVRRVRFQTYAVVYSLDTRGLEPEPDVDALLWWYERGGIQSAESYLRGEHDDDYIADESALGYLIVGLAHMVDWEQAPAHAIAKAVKGSHEATREILTTIFPQRRYLSDFDLDRVVEIRTVKPFAFDWWNPYNEDDTDREPPEDIDVFEWETEINFTFKTLWSNPQPFAGEPEFHGSTGFELQEAFPELGYTADLQLWDLPLGDVWSY